MNRDTSPERLKPEPIMIRSSVWILLLTLFPSLVVAALVRSEFDRIVRPFLTEHCLDCHNADTAEGEFRLDTLPSRFDTVNAALWAEALGRINAGETPPKEMPRPEAAEIATVADRIAASLHASRLERMTERSGMRHDRLSREEYEHAVFDLLGVRYDTQAPGAFSPDPIWHGFERIGSELSLAPAHLEKSLAAAETIIGRAFPEATPQERTRSRDAIAIHWNISSRRAEIENAGLADDVRVVLWPGERLTGANPGALDAGRYRVRVTLSGVFPAEGPRPHLTVFSKTAGRMLFEADVDAPETEPTTLEFEVWLPDGNAAVAICNEVPGPHNKGRSGRSSDFLFTTLADPSSRAPWQRKLSDDDGHPLYPLLLIDRVEWSGPIVTDADRAKRSGVIPPDEADREAIRHSLARFASRAWRRVVAPAEVESLVRLVDAGLSSGQMMREAMRPALVATLVSHEFTYLSFGKPGVFQPELTDEGLAARLSFFLWSSVPDAELSEAARHGRLSNPSERLRQVRRLLDDPKAGRFARSFPIQWLQLQQLGQFPPDEMLYPDYDV